MKHENNPHAHKHTADGHELEPLGEPCRVTGELLSRVFESLAHGGPVGLAIMAAWDRETGKTVGTLCMTFPVSTRKGEPPQIGSIPLAIIPNDRPLAERLAPPDAHGSCIETFTGTIDDLMRRMDNLMTPDPAQKYFDRFADLDDSKLPKA